MRKPGTSIEETMEAQYEWSKKPVAERQRLAQAAAEIEKRKIEAAQFGLSVEEAEAVKQTEALKSAGDQSEYAPVADRIQRLFPTERAPETMNKLAGWTEHLQKHGEAGYLDLMEAAGVDFNKLAYHAEHRNVTRMVEDFSTRAPDFAQHQTAIAGILKDARFQKTGNHQADLATAYQIAKQLWNEREARAMQAGQRRGRTIDDTMRMVGNRLMA